MKLLTLARLGRRFINAGLDLIYPTVCQICERERTTARAGFVCRTCRSQTRFITPPFCNRCGLPFAGEITTAFECSNCREMELDFDHARAAVTLDGPVQTALHRFKYSRAEWFEPFLARLLIARAAPELAPADWDFIIPVPLHGVKLREREFNQADRLARRLAKVTGIRHDSELLRRVKPTETQIRLSRAERAANLRGAFEANHASLHGAHVTLVDDVLTTGATTSAAAAALRKAGVARVAVWTVARGTLRPVLSCESAANI